MTEQMKIGMKTDRSRRIKIYLSSRRFCVRMIFVVGQ